MEDKFLVIGITLPEAYVPNEALWITEMLHSGALDRMHLRKPNADKSILRSLLDEIPQELHSRLSIHDAPELLNEYPSVGFQLNSRYPSGINDATLSRSCHTTEEVLASERSLQYVMLSPVFDSISKDGYRGRLFDGEKEALSLRRVIALGGVTPCRFRKLKDRGFCGAAMLGYLWNLRHSVYDIINEINENRC